MKKLIIAITSMMLALSAHAQPWMPANTHTPVKLADIIANYKKQHADQDEKEEKEKNEKKGKTIGGKQVVDEDGNYQFDRWVWYWKQHLDTNGYMVSPVKTQQEWDAYMAQQKQVSKLAKTTGESNWVFQGPTQSEGGYYGLGRINAIAFDPVDSNTFYIGSAGGGAWKTADNGLSWSPLYNDITSLGVSDIAVNPLNHNTIYVCTGDGDGNDTYSIGVIKSIDGGNTWNNTGLTLNTNQFININSIIINPQDTNTLLIATSNGTYKSVNGGAFWSHQNLGIDFKRILYNPADTNIVYASSYDNAQIYRSTNGGVAWTQVTSFSNDVRANIAVTPANPAIVKAIVCNTQYGLEGIFSSSDSGATFTRIYDGTDCSNNILANSPDPAQAGDCTGQGWYDLPIAISPVDSNQVLVGGVNTWASSDGGNTWQIANQWYSALPGIETAHADKHVFAFNPLTPTELYEGNDGGVYRSLDPTSELWTDLTNGMGITQFYRISVDNSATFVIGGAQDNGCKMLSAAGVASELTGGDGMQTQIDYSDPNDIFYTESEYGYINRTTDGGNSYTGISNNIPGNPTGDWITPFVIHPQIPSTLLAGYDQVYYSIDRGDSWSSISPAFPTLVGNPNLYIDRIQIAPTNPNYIYVVVSVYGYSGSSYIYYTTDFGNTWNNINNIYDRPISDLVVDPKNENHIWVTFSGYGNVHVADYNVTTNVWTTQNAGLTNIPTNCLAIDSSNGTLYLGTEVAVFYRDTASTTWELYNTNLPSVRINDLGINYTTGELWAATFGRGMWKTMKHQDTASTGNTGISIVPLVSDMITVAPNPNKGSFTISTANTSYFDQHVSIKMIADDGQTAWQNEGTFSGDGRLSINASGVAKGIYICEVKGDKVLARARVVVL